MPGYGSVIRIFLSFLNIVVVFANGLVNECERMLGAISTQTRNSTSNGSLKCNYFL